MIKIVHKHELQGVYEHGDIYIGRPSALGNPYVIGKDGNRDEVIARYKQYIWGKYSAGDERVCSAIREIMDLEEITVVRLVCWCAPKACHGDVIKAMISYIRSIS